MGQRRRERGQQCGETRRQQSCCIQTDCKSHRRRRDTAAVSLSSRSGHRWRSLEALAWRRHRPWTKSIVLNVYGFLVDSYEHGDEIYIFGFSRGSYAARALAGLIGASGIQRQRSADAVELAWKHYRINPTVRNGEQPPGSADKLTLQRFEKLKASDGLSRPNHQMCRCLGYRWVVRNPHGVWPCTPC